MAGDSQEGGIMKGGEAFIAGIMVGLLLMAFFILFLDPESAGRLRAYAELCPVILQDATAADSLAAFQEHEGCWDFVQRGAS